VNDFLTNYAVDKLLQYRYNVFSSRSELFGDDIAIFDIFNINNSKHWIGIKYFGSGKRFTKWTAEVWIVESSTNKETKLTESFQKALTITDKSTDDSGVCIKSSKLLESSILRIEITITEWKKL